MSENKHLLEKEENGFNKKEIIDYPMILKAADVAEILKISKPSAYQVMEQTDFPLIRMENRCKRVLRDSFYNWLVRGDGKKND